MRAMSDVSELTAIIEKIALKNNIKNYEIVFEEGNKKGDGFMGELTFFEMKTQLKNYNIVLKRAFKDKCAREDNPVRSYYLNEVYFYEELLPEIQKFQRDRNLPVFHNIAQCYLTSNDLEDEYLALKNLKHLGYEIFDAKQCLSYYHFDYIFKIYGQFHATSFLYRKLHPEKFQKISETLKRIPREFFKSDVIRDMFKRLFEVVGEKLVPGEYDDVIREYKKYFVNGIPIFIDAWEYKNGLYPVLNHGDCWSNNMMFKYDDHHRITDLKLIDFQLAKIGSAVHDLSYSLYSGGSKEIFDRLDDLLLTYHATFSSVLRSQGFYAEKEYPMSTLKEEWRKYSPFGYCLSFIVLKIKLTEVEDKIDCIDISNSEDKSSVGKKMVEGFESEEYDRKIRNLLRHLYDIKAL